MPDAVLLDGAMFLKASLHCLKTQRGGWGGRSPRHFQTQRLSHGRMILEAVLCVSKTSGGWNGRNPPSICKQNACIMSFDEFYNNYALDVVLVDGAMFLKASLHGLKRKARGFED